MQCDDIEVYLSGYIEQELPQQQDQKVRLHLQECERCQQLLGELRDLKRGTRELRFHEPSRKEWKQMEQKILQNISRGAGWLVLIVWSIVTAGYSLFQLATSPNEPIFEKILVFGLFLGLGLVFLSVLFERLRESRTDRYKGVQK